MKKHVILLLAALMLLTLIGCGEKKQEKYTIYVGLNDADTGEQALGVEHAQEAARKVITDMGYGFTEYIAYGAYPDNGTVHGNNSLVYTLFFIPKEDAISVANKIKSELHLDSILIEESESIHYYAD